MAPGFSLPGWDRTALWGRGSPSWLWTTECSGGGGGRGGSRRLCVTGFEGACLRPELEEGPSPQLTSLPWMPAGPHLGVLLAEWGSGAVETGKGRGRGGAGSRGRSPGLQGHLVGPCPWWGLL